MKCVCGYSFAHKALETPKPFNSYAIINDSQYRRFLRTEMKAVDSRDLKDIARASRYVGSLMICPDCGCVRINWPGADMPESFFREIPPPSAPEPETVDPDTFRTLALALPEAVEAPHFEKTSFRARKKIFATMAPEKAEAVVKLTSLDQEVFCGNGGGAVQPVKGKWGEQGWTSIQLEAADRALVSDMLIVAYRTVAPKSLAAQVGQ